LVCEIKILPNKSYSLMTKVAKIFESIDKFLQEILSEAELREKYLEPLSFVRNRLLNLQRVCAYFLWQNKCSLSIGLEEFSDFFEVDLAVSKSAFSQARYKISPRLFKDMLTKMQSSIYENGGEGLKRWNGFLVKAVDGTTLDVPDTCDIWSVLGGVQNQYGRKTLARAVLEIDVLNGIITQANVGKYGSDELALSVDFLANNKSDDLLIYDRKYGNFALMYKHFHYKVPFLMRVKANLNKQIQAFVESNLEDAVLTIPISTSGFNRLTAEGFEVDKSTTVTIRAMKIMLDSGELEVLVTNFLDEASYPLSEFKALYALRWGAETRIEIIKNKFQLELFSSHKSQGIEQEFYAVCIALNLHTLIWKEAEKKLEKNNKKREEKGLAPQQINKNVAIGLIQRKMLNLLFFPKKREAILERLIQKIIRYKIANKPNRKNPRKFKTHRRRGKYRTMNNYRKAI
jgi:Transposase DDE domain